MLYEKWNYVLAIAEEQNLTRAAKRLFISQPALTLYLNRLEKELEVKLFDRSRTPILLTEAGKYYVEQMKKISAAEQSLRSEIRVIADPADIPEEIVKVSVYLPDGSAAYADRFVPRWRQANAAVAGPYWIDTTLANKGLGVQALCRVLGLDPGQVMAFGDNYNDLPMLDAVGLPYIMDGAAPALRARYPRHTPRPEDVLARLLDR